MTNLQIEELEVIALNLKSDITALNGLASSLYESRHFLTKFISNEQLQNLESLHKETSATLNVFDAKMKSIMITAPISPDLAMLAIDEYYSGIAHLTIRAGEVADAIHNAVSSMTQKTGS